MEGLTKRIRGDWFEIKEAADDIHTLEDVFSFTVQELRTMVENLRLSVEHGVTEYKTNALSAVYSYLESLQYDSRGLDALPARAREFSFLLYAALIQRLFASGSLKIRSSLETAGSSRSREGGESDGDLKEILQDVQERMQKDPEVRNHPAVKNIFMQVNIYKRELANMKKLAPNIPPEKQQAFYANFKHTFNEITDKVRQNHSVLLEEDRSAVAREMVPTNPLKKHDLSVFVPVFLEQAKEFSIIRSTLVFAGSERYKTREILSGIMERKDRVSVLVSNESKKYDELEPGPGGGRILSRSFGAEIITVLNRQITRMS